MDQAYKLEYLPKIHYINLESSTQRREYMELQFKELGIVNYERISAVDGGDKGYMGDAFVDDLPASMTTNEIACVMSHLKTMKYWLEKSDEDILMIMEDDCDMSTVNFWGFCWKEFTTGLPFHWDVVQLTVCNPALLTMGLHVHFVNDYSSACYIIRRSHAQKLVNAHCRGERYKLDQNVKPSAVADHLIYNSGFVLAISLFNYKLSMESTIHIDHYSLHKKSHDAVWKFWRQNASAIKDWTNFLSYDPYYGNIPPGIIAKAALNAAKKSAKP